MIGMAGKQAKRPVGRPRAEGTEVIHVRLKAKQRDRLDTIAKEEGTTRTALLQIAVARFLKKGL
jgi:hypothetical protein